jgi:radical SAM superfamily enzyme YgiQ (UPF0313 family)
MASVVLIIPPGNYTAALNYDRFVQTPLEAISALYGYLDHHGHKVQIIDCRAIVDPLRHVLDSLPANPKVIGFTTFFNSFAFVERCVPLIRRQTSQVVIVVGGSLATAAPVPFLEEADVDIVVCREGEKALLSIVEVSMEHDALRHIPGTVTRTHTGEIIDNRPGEIIENLDELPDLDWSYAAPSLVTGEYDFMYSVGRGCSQHCTYCSRPQGFRRFRSPDKVKREIRHLRDRYGMKTMILNDSDFIYDNPKLYEFVSVFNDLQLKWGCFSGPRALTPELLDTLHANGCANLRIGIEAVDLEMIAKHRPDYSLPEMRRMLALLDSSRIQKITCYFLLGLPGQTDRSLNMVIETVERYPRLVPRPFYLIPIPGTVVFQEALRSGQVTSVPAYLRSLDDIPIEGVSERFPHLAAATHKNVVETYDILKSIADSRGAASHCPIIV